MSSHVTAPMYPASTQFAWSRAWAACLCVSMLSGCSWGWNRCETWDRVTHPDYMYPEDTLLHGYHRTTWEAWPNQNCVAPWDSAESAQEAVSTGVPTSELPTPKNGPARSTPKAAPAPETPSAPDEGFVPQALKPHHSAEDWNVHRQRAEAKLLANLAAQRRRAKTASASDAAARKLPEATDALVPPSAAPPTAATPRAFAAVHEDASPEDSAAPIDAVFANRFSTLISRDRKANWKPLSATNASAEFDAATGASDEQITPVVHQEVFTEPVFEEPSPDASAPDDVGAAPVRSSTPEQPAARAPSKAPQGDGEIRLKLKPAA